MEGLILSVKRGQFKIRCETEKISQFALNKWKGEKIEEKKPEIREFEDKIFWLTVSVLFNTSISKYTKIYKFFFFRFLWIILLYIYLISQAWGLDIVYMCKCILNVRYIFADVGRSIGRFYVTLYNVQFSCLQCVPTYLCNKYFFFFLFLVLWESNKINTYW